MIVSSIILIIAAIAIRTCSAPAWQPNDFFRAASERTIVNGEVTFSTTYPGNGLC